MKANDIYPITFKNEPRFAVHLGKKGGFGDPFFKTLEEAEDEVEWQKKRNADNKRAKHLQAKQEQVAAIEKSERENIEGFADDKANFQRARIVKILNVKMTYKGKLTTRKQLVRDNVAAGWTVQETKGKRRFVSPEDTFLIETDITKTAMDYAEYLQGE